MPDEIALLRRRLVKAFPLCFYPKGERKWPLKRDIHLDVIERLPDLTVYQAKKAIEDYTGGPTYLDNMVEHATRFDLDGLPMGVVTAGDAKHAQRRLASLRAKWAAETAINPSSSTPSRTSGNQETHTMCGSSSVSQSSFVKDEAAPDINPTLLTADGVIDVIVRHFNNGDRPLAVGIIERRDRYNVEHGRTTAPSTELVPVAATNVVAKDAISEKLKLILSLIPTKKIEAIKELRALSGMSLKESKDWVEGLAGTVPVRNSEPSQFKKDGYMMLTRYAGDYNFGTQATYDYRDSAVDAAERETRGADTNTEIILVEVIGRTKPVFAMLTAA